MKKLWKNYLKNYKEIRGIVITMIETVVALLMFVNGEIKEHRCAKKHGPLPSREAPRGERVFRIYNLQML